MIIFVSFCSDETMDNHTVLAEVRGVVGPEGGQLSSPETGVSVIIPSAALKSRQEIYFKVCRDESMVPPLDKEKGI